MTRLLALAGLLAGCAPAAPLALGPDHPARPDAPATPATVEVAALDRAPEPRVPDVLRPDGPPPAGSVAGRDPEVPPHGADHDATTDNPAATMEADEATMAHTAMNHGRTVVDTPSPTPPGPLGDVAPAPPTPLGDVLDAYLVVQQALAADQFDAQAAAAFEGAFADLAETPPPGDPHVWHTRGDDVRAASGAAAALTAAGSLEAARTAFGALSAPFARLVEAAGAPEGYGLVRHTCGMRSDAPEGGVWLQRAGETRNPYFGTSMLLCGTRDGAVPAAGGAGHGSADHGGR